jgi:hypothetical protein
VGESANLSIESTNLEVPWDMAFTPASIPMRPILFSPLEPLPGGQLINLSATSPLAFSLFGFSFTQPFFPVVSGFVASSPVDVYTQMMIFSPPQPSGVALSAAAGLHVVDRGSGAIVPGPSADDAFIQILPGAQPLCGPAAVTFAGTAYSSFFVSSNGFVSFGAGSADPTPTVAEFQSGPPRLAALWADLDPGSGGTVSTTAFQAALVVSFNDVPRSGAASASETSTLEVVFDTATGECSISRYQPSPGPFAAALVGLTPGMGVATDPGPRNFAALAGLGLQSGAATDMVYQFLTGAAPTGFSSIRFPSSDGSAFIVE